MLMNRRPQPWMRKVGLWWKYVELRYLDNRPGFLMCISLKSLIQIVGFSFIAVIIIFLSFPRIFKAGPYIYSLIPYSLQSLHEKTTMAMTNLESLLQTFGPAPLCLDNGQANDGAWLNTNDSMLSKMNMTKLWQPNQCRLMDFKQDDLIKCFANKKIGFYGDSLLLGIYGQLRTILDQTNDESQWEYGPGGYSRINMNESDGYLDFWWAPSAFHQQPHTLQLSKLESMDAVIVGMTVWNMGSDYDGIDAFYHQMEENLKQTRSAMDVNAELYLFNSHKLWPERCEKKDGPCYKCNDDFKAGLFRQSIHKLIACNDGVSMFDTFGLTNTSFAASDGSDAVHYHKTTVYNELKVLLNMICPRPDDQSVMKATDIKMENRTNCERVNYDEMLQAFSPKSNESCMS